MTEVIERDATRSLLKSGAAPQSVVHFTTRILNHRSRRQRNALGNGASILSLSVLM